MAKATVYLPDELYQRVQDSGVPISPTCQRALEHAVAMVGDTAPLVIEMCDQDERHWKVEFNGRWLVGPGQGSTTRAYAPEACNEEGYNPDARYGIAITAKGRIVMYVSSADAKFVPEYYIYPSLSEAFAEWDPDFEIYRWPRDVIHAAADALGEDLIVKLDI